MAGCPQALLHPLRQEAGDPVETAAGSRRHHQRDPTAREIRLRRGKGQVTSASALAGPDEGKRLDQDQLRFVQR